MSSPRELLATLVDCLRQGRPVAYCRLVETRGSTPQKAGALMLVFPDGSQAGTLGGGCVEAEVKRRALAVLDRQTSELLPFQLDSDYGWDDGLICGGRMLVLVESLTSSNGADYFLRLEESARHGEGVQEAIVFDSEKSGLSAPACFLFSETGKVLASRHAPGEAPPLVRENLPELTKRPRPCARQGVAYLPLLQRCRLLIVGGGHVGWAVGRGAAELDFDVWIVDDREEFTSEDRFPFAQRRVCGPIEEVLQSLEVTPDTYCLIVTRGHQHDEEALYHLVDRGARYVGMIGSRRKIKLIFDDLQDRGVSVESLARVHAPLGIEIGSQTVPEIAVSILAELIAHRNLQGQIPGRPAPVLSLDCTP